MCQKDNGAKSMNGSRKGADVVSKPLFPAKDRSVFAKGEISSEIHFKRVSQFLVGIMISAATLGFSLWFPFVMAPHAASKTYVPAFYHYNPEDSLFDNTIWTYATDYALLLIMGGFSIGLLYMKCNKNQVSEQLVRCSSALLGLYAISVFAGGWAHHNYHDVDLQNTWHFRALWTLCVGTVSLAGGIMGLAGTKLARGFHNLPTVMGQKNNLPIIPEPFWIGFGIFQALVCAYGGISYQRPACDIFIAGTTQFPSTFYVILALWLRDFKQETRRIYRVAGYIGFIWNAPLLPMYPLLVQYTDWSLGTVNTLLHGWLLVGWTLQGICLGHCCHAIEKLENPSAELRKAEKTL